MLALEIELQEHPEEHWISNIEKALSRGKFHKVLSAHPNQEQMKRAEKIAEESLSKEQLEHVEFITLPMYLDRNLSEEEMRKLLP